MTPEIKYISSPDMTELETWCPSDPEEVYMLLELESGPFGDPGADSFQVVLAIPAALRVHRRLGVRSSPRHCLVVKETEAAQRARMAFVG